VEQEGHSLGVQGRFWKKTPGRTGESSWADRSAVHDEEGKRGRSDIFIVAYAHPSHDYEKEGKDMEIQNIKHGRSPEIGNGAGGERLFIRVGGIAGENQTSLYRGGERPRAELPKKKEIEIG